jgi:etoposide-induced 2.4 mRNA
MTPRLKKLKYGRRWTFSSKSWPLDHRVRYMQERTSYMIGFGESSPPCSTPAVHPDVFPVPMYRFNSYTSLVFRSPSSQYGSLRHHIPFRKWFSCEGYQISDTAENFTQFVIQALLSRPPVPRSSLLPSTPSPHASLPPSPSGGTINLTDPFFSSASSASDWSSKAGFQLKVPIFFFAQFALAGLQWLETALGRERSGERRHSHFERSGKRAM